MSQTFQSYAPYPPDALYVSARTGELTAITGLTPNQQKALQSMRNNPVAARNLYIPLTIELLIDPEIRPAPLTLYITPNTIRRDMIKGLSENRFRRGVEPEFWGDEFDVWNFVGQIAAFYTRDHGITQLHRGSSAGYQNFLSLLTFYKNNGRDYWNKGQVIEANNAASRLTLPPNEANRKATGQIPATGRRVTPSPLVPKTEKLVINLDGVIKHVGGVRITYDGWSVIGHFDNFNWTESVNQPFTLTYNMRFTVNYTKDIFRSAIASQIRG